MIIELQLRCHAQLRAQPHTDSRSLCCRRCQNMFSPPQLYHPQTAAPEAFAARELLSPAAFHFLQPVPSASKQGSTMQRSSVSYASSPSSTSAAARARQLLVLTSSMTSTSSQAPRDTVLLPSSVLPAEFDDMQSPKRLASFAAAAPSTPSERARALLARQARESGDSNDASTAAQPAIYDHTSSQRALSVQLPVSPAEYPALTSGISDERARMPPRSSSSSSSSSSVGGDTTAALVRCLQLSRSGDLWFGPQLQLALEGASPSSSSDFLLLPWIISNCSRRVPTIFATTSATRPRTRPLDDHTLAVMRSLMRFVARLFPLFLASTFVLSTGTCAVFWIPHAYYGRMCSGETAHWLQRCGGANCSVDTPHAFCSLDAAAVALQPFVAATPG